MRRGCNEDRTTKPGGIATRKPILAAMRTRVENPTIARQQENGTLTSRETACPPRLRQHDIEQPPPLPQYFIRNHVWMHPLLRPVFTNHPLPPTLLAPVKISSDRIYIILHTLHIETVPRIDPVRASTRNMTPHSVFERWGAFVRGQI